MRVATLQLDFVLGDVPGNISKADAIITLNRDRLKNLDILVLPELAFTGYNHLSSEGIAPYIEPTSSGPSTLWAQKTAQCLSCTVAVGYPERDTTSNEHRAYNSLVFVDRWGAVVGHSRKSFLYYTDETWASEGSGFFVGDMQLGSSASHTKTTKVAAGICMDVNPYKFEAPWTAYEFANHVLTSKAELVILSTAWLTRLSKIELSELPQSPDLDTVSYWLQRFEPLVEASGPEKEIVVVVADRCGQEGQSPVMGEVNYAGSSTVIGMTRGNGRSNGEVRIWDILGRNEEGLLVVDTDQMPRYRLKRTSPKEDQDMDTPGHEDRGTSAPNQQ